MQSNIPAIFHRNDNRPNYSHTVKTGLIISLIAFIATFKIEVVSPDNFNNFYIPPDDKIVFIDIPITKIETIPPKPMLPKVPVAVPDDEIIDEEPINLGFEIELGNALQLPPPPKEDKEEVFDFIDVERKPKLIGGLASLQKSIVYPEMALKARIQGTVFLKFQIDERGRVINPIIVRGIGAGCDEVALKAIQKAKFTPGIQNGRPVKVTYTIPIRFRIAD